MKLQDIINVLIIVQEKSFSKAAAKLYVSQAAISQSIARLEQELGTPLFIRSTKNIQPTEACLLFVEKGRPIVEAFDQFCAEMKDVRKEHKRHIRVGVSSFFSRFLSFQKEVQNDTEKFPFDVKIVEDINSVIEQMTIDRKVDFCFSRAPLRQNKLQYEPLFVEEIFLAVPATHPICQRIPNTAEDPYPTINLQYFKNSSFTMIKNSFVTNNCIKMCLEAGFTPRIVMSTTVWERIQTYVAEMNLVGFISHLFTKPYTPDSRIRYFRIDSSYVKLEHIVAYVSKKDLSVDSKVYIDAFRDFLQLQTRGLPMG